MQPKNVMVTGAAGYLGRALCRSLALRPWCERVEGFDVRAPAGELTGTLFTRMDVNDPDLTAYVRDRAPDALVHLAFVVDPIHDAQRMRRINIDGTRRVLAAASAAKVEQVLVASSGTVYGARPDNPVPIDERAPIRPVTAFQYAREKGELEAIFARFAEAHPETAVSVIRPCVVYGPGVNNYLSGLLTRLPVVIGMAGHDPELQFVHEDDVAGATIAILEAGARGAFNIAPPDTIGMAEVLRLPGKPVIRLPDRVLTPLVQLLWRLRVQLFGAPASFLPYMRYPWVLDSRRLREEVGFAFRYSSRETLEAMLRAKGVLV